MLLIDLIIQTPGAMPALIWGAPGEAKTAFIQRILALDIA